MIEDSDIDVAAGTINLDKDFTVESFQLGRTNWKCFKVFMDHFAPILEKKQNWTSRVVGAKEDKQVLTVSSEVFGLLLLENQWDRWIDQYIIGRGTAGSPKERREKQAASKVAPKYTRGGIHVESDSASNHSSTNSIQKGWLAIGIRRFNELFKLVVNDRKKHPDVFKRWQKDFVNELVLEQGVANLKTPADGPGIKSNEGGGVYVLEGDEEDFAKDKRNKDKAKENLVRLERETTNLENTLDEAEEEAQQTEKDEEPNKGQADEEEEENEFDGKEVISSDKPEPPSNKGKRKPAGPPFVPKRPKKTRRGKRR